MTIIDHRFNEDRARLRKSTKRVRAAANSIGLLAGAGVIAVALGLHTPGPLKLHWTPAQIQAAVSYSQQSRKDAITRYLSEKFRQKPDRVRQIVDYAWLAADEHKNVTPELILAVIQKESSLRSGAQSSYGAQGLMQVVRRWHPEKLRAGESLFDTHVNMRVGAEILQEYIDLEGNLPKALVKYSANAGGYSDFVLKEMQVLKNI